MRTGITCKKIPCYMRDSACRWLIVENAKIFRSYVKHFKVFPRERNCRILIGLHKKVFMNHPIIFLNQDNKTKLDVRNFALLSRKISYIFRILATLVELYFGLLVTVGNFMHQLKILESYIQECEV